MEDTEHGACRYARRTWNTPVFAHTPRYTLIEYASVGSGVCVPSAASARAIAYAACNAESNDPLAAKRRPSSSMTHCPSM